MSSNPEIFVISIVTIRVSSRGWRESCTGLPVFDLLGRKPEDAPESPAPSQSPCTKALILFCAFFASLALCKMSACF